MASFHIKTKKMFLVAHEWMMEPQPPQEPLRTLWKSVAAAVVVVMGGVSSHSSPPWMWWFLWQWRKRDWYPSWGTMSQVDPQ
jgi:hypothetical protein